MARKNLKSAITAFAAIALAGATLTACASEEPAATETDGNASSEEQRVVRLGVVGESDPYWAVYEEAVEAELDIDLEFVDFGGYELVNGALASGEIDINQFQHIIFLAQHNVASGDDLTVIGSTATYPLGVHSLTHESIEDIPEGGKVAIPNDATNGARALLVLQQAGLVELQDGGSTLSTVNDLLPTSKVEVVEVDPALTATTLRDVDAAVINNDFVQKAGLDFDAALFQDDPNQASALPYVNIFAVRAADQDDEVLNRLVEIYHSTQEVLDLAFETSGNTAIFTNTPKADLQQVLETEEETVRQAQG